MSRRGTTVAAIGLALASAALAGCGGGSSSGAPKTTTRADAPPLLTAAKRAGEVLASGQSTPATHGPLALHGRYRVRFAQYAPENPHQDFTQQTAFVADLRPGGDLRAKPIRLFRTAAARGTRVLKLDGRYTLEVTFGDFPWVVRFTPARRRSRS